MRLRHLIALGATVVGSLGLAMPAVHADTVPVGNIPSVAGTGFDGLNDIVNSGGSDTTYLVQQQITNLYNSSNGCITNDTAGTRDICTVPAPKGYTNTTMGNYDHDVVSQVHATGSGGGIACMLATAVCNIPLDMARSSRVPSAAEFTAGANGWAYGKDGVIVVTLGSRLAFQFDKPTLQAIYCTHTITDFNQIAGYTGPAGAIVPWGMNTASGTYGVFKAYLGCDPSIAPNRALSSGTYPFENDVNQIVADVTPAILSNSIWWMSYAEWKTLPFKTNSATVNYWKIQNAAGQFRAPSNSGINATNGTSGSYNEELKRYIWQVTKKADADSAAITYPTITGGAGGKSGAVREYVRWLCENPADSAINPNTGANSADDISASITNTGFIAVPTAERNFGTCLLQRA